MSGWRATQGLVSLEPIEGALGQEVPKQSVLLTCGLDPTEHCHRGQFHLGRIMSPCPTGSRHKEEARVEGSHT